MIAVGIETGGLVATVVIRSCRDKPSDCILVGRMAVGLWATLPTEEAAEGYDSEPGGSGIHCA